MGLAVVLGRGPNGSAATHPVVMPTALELDGPGVNVDDACAWFDAERPSSSLLFVTTKDSGLVEVFDIGSGALVDTIRGLGRPNNCVVEGNLLLVTDRESTKRGVVPGQVKVYEVPGLRLVRTLASDTREPHGVDVLLTPDGSRHVYVTDSADATVHVYDLDSGSLVRVFATGFGRGIEPILADDVHQRIFVARGEKEKRRGIGVFDPKGKFIREFGADVFGNDVEGMAIYACDSGGYLVAADQHKRETQFEVFDRRSLEHVGTFRLQDGTGEFTDATDGIAILQEALPGYPSGLLAACDGCGTNLPDEMDVVSWERVADALALDRCPGGRRP